MSPTTIVGIVVILALIVYLVVYGNPTAAAIGSEITILKGSMRGASERSEGIVLPPSYNQPQGLTYSYACWVLVKDFTTGYGKRRQVFSKNDSPGLFLDSTSNTLVVKISTFKDVETILIPNIPAQKWIHFALVVDQHAVDIYINGMLRRHHTLSQLPKENDSPINMGGEWNGVLARLSSWARSISVEEVKKLAAAPLPDDLDRKPAGPQYFDITWYIGRLYSA
jgi:hypothetical protein